ncbi:hypothetical protein G8764_07990 [Pseudomaricurvus alcaniphilus]|nr:hypothetical protein [Pseudomaricurvus alcaniphilus]
MTGSVTGAIALFIASSMVTSILGFRQFERITTTPAWVMSANLPQGSIITRDSLEQVRIDKDLTETSIQNPRQLLGRELKIGKRSGDLVRQQDIKLPAQTSLSHAIPAGRVLYTLPNVHGGMPFSKLSTGDRLDVVVRGNRVVRTVARDIQLIGIINPEKGNLVEKDKGVMSLLQPNSSEREISPGHPSLVMAVRPADVFPLASIGAKDKVSLILHSAHDIAMGKKINVDPEKTYREVEVVSGLQRSKVRIGL